MLLVQGLKLLPRKTKLSSRILHRRFQRFRNLPRPRLPTYAITSHRRKHSKRSVWRADLPGAADQAPTMIFEPLPCERGDVSCGRATSVVCARLTRDLDAHYVRQSASRSSSRLGCASPLWLRGVVHRRDVAQNECRSRMGAWEAGSQDVVVLGKKWSRQDGSCGCQVTSDSCGQLCMPRWPLLPTPARGEVWRCFFRMLLNIRRVLLNIEKVF